MPAAEAVVEVLPEAVEDSVPVVVPREAGEGSAVLPGEVLSAVVAVLPEAVEEVSLPGAVVVVVIEACPMAVILIRTKITINCKYGENGEW